MWKLQSLRTLIEAAVPDLKANPENLVVLASGGRAVSAMGKSLSFEYAYTIDVTVLDFTGHTDALFVPLIAWLRVHQPELLLNPTTQATGLQFQVELLNTAGADIGIRVPVTERVIVTPDPGHPTRLICDHPAEPQVVGTNRLPEHWQLWLKDQLLAEWDIPTPPEEARFVL
ncbi:phage tail protein [Comamonas piscis]|uniref:Phage tail protein n=1 Tax=Comamonas piscis TaxID=1562974 RepID=A0A7G5EM03_9BURK|nr:phage tail protein [Comamonas piscis]QMV75028.1 phage tail protein [Comamonas piscis]WSO33509.1 phage tail protein [Comamonas piscis]